MLYVASCTAVPVSKGMDYIQFVVKCIAANRDMYSGDFYLIRYLDDLGYIVSDPIYDLKMRRSAFQMSIAYLQMFGFILPYTAHLFNEYET